MSGTMQGNVGRGFVIHREQIRVVVFYLIYRSVALWVCDHQPEAALDWNKCSWAHADTRSQKQGRMGGKEPFSIVGACSQNTKKSWAAVDPHRRKRKQRAVYKKMHSTNRVGIVCTITQWVLEFLGADLY